MVRARQIPVLPVGTGTRNPAKEIPTGQPYGAATEQRTALQAVPAAGPTLAATPPVTAPEPPQGPPQVDPQAALAAASGYNPTGPTLSDPTQNPNEPVTAGLASGPGPGPEALNMPNPQQQDVATWAHYLPTLEYLASLPNSTATTRNFVRQLRASMPPTAAMT